MSPAASFEIQLEGGIVRGRLYHPVRSESDTDPSSSPMPAVLICRGVNVPGEDAHGLFDDLTDALCSAGIAAVLFDHRCADLILEDFDAQCAKRDEEDAAAVLRWIAKRSEIDLERIGLLGFSLGAITASSLAKRHGHITRFCLLAASTAAYVRNRMVKANGAPAPINAEQLPAAFIPSLADVDSPADAAAHARPTLIVHGAADRFVAPEVSLEYLRVLEAAKRPVEHVFIARADHTFTLPETRAACIAKLTAFFGNMSHQHDSHAAAVRSA